MSLEELRTRIDEIDTQLVDLLNERARVVMEIGKLKAQADRPIYAPDREKQVLKLVAEGKSNKEVAEVLGISVKTAMSHREHVMEKLGVHNRTELVRFAIKKGVIRVDE